VNLRFGMCGIDCAGAIFRCAGVHRFDSLRRLAIDSGPDFKCTGEEMKLSKMQIRWLASLAILGAVAAPSYAVDGVVLINQSAALAGGVVPFDAPGFPVTIEVSGSYRLSGNLVVPDAKTTAIQILASNVTLDLNGFSITGPVQCTGFPVTSCIPFATGSG